MRPPTNLRQVQCLIGSLAALSRFISRLGHRALPFFKILRSGNPIEWTPEADAVFNDPKENFSSPPVLIASEPGEPLLLYIATTDDVTSLVLVVERLEHPPCGKPSAQRPPKQGVEIGDGSGGQPLAPRKVQRHVYFVSEVLRDAPLRYQEVQKLHYAIIIASRKLCHFDGSSRRHYAGAGVVLVSPTGEKLRYVFYLFFQATNNVAKYEGLVVGLTLALSFGIKELWVMGDSQLIIDQVNGECACNHPWLAAYLLKVKQMQLSFDVIEFKFIHRELNKEADELSTMVSTRQHTPDGVFDYRVPYPTARIANPEDDGRNHLWMPVVASTSEAPPVGEESSSPANVESEPAEDAQVPPAAWIPVDSCYYMVSVTPRVFAQ